MYNFKIKLSLLSIRSKIIIAFLFGCFVVALSWSIARIVFTETFNTIDLISEPNPKLIIINNLFQKIQRLDYSQKVQVLKFQDKPYTAILDESKNIVDLLDSLKMYCIKDTLQVNRILHMQKVLYERDNLFANYLKYRYSILKNNPLSKDIRNLSDYISQKIKGDSNVVKTTKKNTTTTTILTVENPERKVNKKESFLKRVFNRKKNKEQQHQPAQLVTENIQETVDTFAITQRDSFMKDMERAISSIEEGRNSRRSELANHELKLAAASTIFIDELEQLLRQVQNEEILDLQMNTGYLGNVFSKAFNWAGIILCTFLLLILVLIFLIFADISQSNKIKLQLIEAKERAEYLEQVKHRFLANMSHEIRTPLQAIIGYSEQIKDQENPPKESLKAIYHSSEYLLQIVNEVLDYSRIVSGKFVFEAHDFDMELLIAEIADIMEGQAEKKNVRFKIKTEIPHGQLYSGDALRLKQILFNLLGNAIKFTYSGEIYFIITSKDVDASKTEFTFEITDTGVGITQEDLKRIFNSFEQAGENTQRQYGGTGLGLSIVKKLTEMQNGSITVCSEKDKGSSFKVTLPYFKSLTEKQQMQPSLSLNNIVYSGKVLVVDDDAFILGLCSSILQKHHVNHICYYSSEKVLADKWDESVDLVLIDIRMPVINGIALYQHLKRKVKGHVKFVALTAQALPDEKEAILKHGFDLVLLKPFREKDLLQLFTENIRIDTHTPYNTGDHFDLSSIVLMCSNDEKLIQKNLALFVKETKADLTVLMEGVNEENKDKVIAACHKLAAKVGQVGFNLLSYKLRSLETKVIERKFVFDKNVFTGIENEIQKVIDKVKSHVA